MCRGNFIVVEGIDGSGKSTAVNIIKNFLEEEDRSVVTTSALDNSSVGKGVRELITSGQFKPLHVDVQSMFMCTAIRNSLHNNILPALAEGKMVICDRYTPSTRVYQKEGKDVEYMCDSTEEILPLDIVFYMDVDIGVATKRLESRGMPLDDLETSDYEIIMERKYTYEDVLENMSPKKLFVIDANQSLGNVKKQIVRYLRTLYTN